MSASYCCAIWRRVRVRVRNAVSQRVATLYALAFCLVGYVSFRLFVLLLYTSSLCQTMYIVRLCKRFVSSLCHLRFKSLSNFRSTVQAFAIHFSNVSESTIIKQNDVRKLPKGGQWFPINHSKFPEHHSHHQALVKPPKRRRCSSSLLRPR